jgi:DNA-binding response OmpR family regulator
MTNELVRTLVVDDEFANRDFIVRLFQTAKLDVYGAASGSEGIDIARRFTSLQFAFIDHELPDAKGIDIIRQLREIHREAILVMATVHDHREVIDQAFAAGADIFLVKPHGFMELYRRVLERQPNCANLRELIIDQYGPRPYRGPKRNTQAVVAVSV